MTFEDRLALARIEANDLYTEMKTMVFELVLHGHDPYWRVRIEPMIREIRQRYYIALDALYALYQEEYDEHCHREDQGTT